ncbi:hypothetical protein Cgig2_014973 [Carnegiea gigantea]|uniref:Histidine decarboxylase n=1 Tax=Carnegiea gigantea TaxID=171969 RepID=A0A9Q1JWQ2_9CARY|nr:hypothetical protein Cgig2_014973 [Carnegiea gigantea]
MNRNLRFRFQKLQTSVNCSDSNSGYPLDYNFDYGALNMLQPFPLNNFGDPFTKSNYSVNSKQIEVGVLDWFARLWEIENDEYWGYVTSGGTEANLQGILMGREVFPDGILYASKESHYSVFKAARMYRMDCIKIETLIMSVLTKSVLYPLRWSLLFVEQNAKYLKDRLRNARVSVMLNELSNIVVSERPPDEEFIKRWLLSCQRKIARVVVMVNVSKQKLDAFLDELTEKLSNWSKEGARPCVAVDIGYENCLLPTITIEGVALMATEDVVATILLGWLQSRGGSHSNNNASAQSHPSRRSVLVE